MTAITDALQKVCNQVYRWIPQPRPSQEQLDQIKIVAHRGCWNQRERLENTMAAFLESLNHDIWAIEFDIRWTQDNVPVVHHDATTERVFGSSLRISETPLQDLLEAHPAIPLLKEVVQTFGGRIHLMIELKTILTPMQAQTLNEILKDLEPIDDYHFMSLEGERFQALHFVPKTTFVSIARTNINRVYNETLEKGWGAVTGQYLLLTEKKIKEAHKKGVQVGTGFPDSKNLLYREARRNVDWVFTNEAAKIAAYKK